MRKRKGAVTLLCIVVGLAIFATTAFADILLGSGYSNLKDTGKRTVNMVYNGDVRNFSMEGKMALKDSNGTVYHQAYTTTKTDLVDFRTETNSTDTEGNETNSYYYYTDSRMMVSNNSREPDIYYVNNFEPQLSAKEIKERILSEKNPLEQEEFKDIEKIADALVGNLADVIHVSQSADGTRVYNAELNETQVPPVVNAIISFGLKQSMFNEYSYRGGMNSAVKMPKIVDEIYIESVTGFAKENNLGMIESAVGQAVFSGKDDVGQVHKFIVEVDVRFYDVNNTTFMSPDLTGKKTEVSTINPTSNGRWGNKYVGTYKSYIVEDKGERFEQVGTRFIEITSANGDTVSGRFYEVFEPGYVSEEAPLSFNFTSTYNEERPWDSFITFTDNRDGQQYNGTINETGRGSLYVDLYIEPYDNGGYRSYSYDKLKFWNGEFFLDFDSIPATETQPATQNPAPVENNGEPVDAFVTYN